MMKNLLLLLFLALSFNMHAQGYEFTLLNGAYTNLEGSTSLNDGMSWDDPQFAIPIGFEFQYFEELITEIYIIEDGLGGFLSIDPLGYDAEPFFVAYGADIIDRGYDFVEDEPTMTSLSNISYLLEGELGSQILKIEWNNVGFYSELQIDGVSTDYTNFQVWLYEGTNMIEIHFGENNIQNPDQSYDDETGSWISLIAGYDEVADTLYGGSVILEGPAENPTLIDFNIVNSLIYLEGTVPDSTIYRFGKLEVVDVVDSKVQNMELSISPNPSSDFINLELSNNQSRIETISIFNMKGQKVLQQNYDGISVNIAHLQAGLYLIQATTAYGILNANIIKQ